jgi:hypothetical protein
VAEAALAHTLRDKTEEKRRRLMAEWTAFCARLAATGEVATLRLGADDQRRYTWRPSVGSWLKLPDRFHISISTEQTLAFERHSTASRP